MLTLAEVTERMGLHASPRRVLVVEDAIPWLRRLTAFWEEAGHEVVAMTGVTEIVGHLAIGPGDPEGSVVQVDLQTIDAAFLDHYFLSRTYDGVSLTRELTARGCFHILAMSSDAGANARMAQAGALLAGRKSEWMRLFD